MLDCDMAKPGELYSHALNASTKKSMFWDNRKFLGVWSVIWNQGYLHWQHLKRKMWNCN